MVPNVSQHSKSIQQAFSTVNYDNAERKEKCELKPNTLNNKIMSAYQKTTSAFTEYPAKGLMGSKKSNFYEFLAMGTVPYLVGSAMLMAVFNGAIKSTMGAKAALGVLFYGVAKSVSKTLISTPVKIATGIDTEMAYQRELSTDENSPIQIHEIEQHKVMESHDFPRYDMMYGEKMKDKNGNPLPHNYLFDKIAKKNGLGEDLPASDTEVKPIIKDVISRSNTAKSISSYLWAAAGVTLAVQSSWNNFFRAMSKSNWHKYNPANNNTFVGQITGKVVNTAKNLGRITRSFGNSFVDAAKELYNGPAAKTGWNKHAGKAVLGAALLSSVFGAINTIYGAKTAVGQAKNVFDKKDKITVQ